MIPEYPPLGGTEPADTDPAPPAPIPNRKGSWEWNAEGRFWIWRPPMRIRVSAVTIRSAYCDDEVPMHGRCPGFAEIPGEDATERVPCECECHNEVGR